MKTGKKFLCSFLVALMVLTSVPLGGFVGLEMPDFFYALAAEESANQYLTSGYCGDTTDGGSAKDIAWSLDSSGVLTVTGVGKIAPEAFKYDKRIKEVVISDGILNISSYCFSDCDNLTKVTMGDDVKSVDNKAFYNCDGIKIIELSDSVTTIGKCAFERCTNLVNIKFSNSLTTIGDWAFSHCLKLTSIELPDSLTTIGNDAFYDCDKLTSIDFSDSLITIGDYAFQLCQSLTSIVLSDSLETIGEYAFSLCENLTSIAFPDSLTTISYSAFSHCSKLISIELPDSLTTIDGEAFYSCSNLTSVSIGSNLKSIKFPNVFSDCSKLRTITISDNNENFASYDGIVYDKDMTKFIFVPGAISGEIAIPKTVENFSYESIDSCKGITALNVEEGNKNYKSVDGIVYSANGEKLIVCPRGKTGSVVVADGTKSIGDYAFDNCKGLTSVDFSDTLETIGERAFYGCGGLTSIDFPDTLKTIGSWAFGWCSNLTSIAFPDSLKTIGYDAFYSCLKLTSIAFPDSLETISGGAFYGCDGLTSIAFPDSLETIGSFAFNSCANLTSVSIGANLKSINFLSAFEYCSKLNTITVSNDNMNFASYDGIVYNKEMTKFIYVPNAVSGEITIPKSVESFSSSSIYNCKHITALNVEKGNKNYKSVDGIVYSANGEKLIVCPEGKTGSVVVADGTKSIGDYAFDNCKGLTSVDFSDTLETIGERAFYYCKGLTSIAFPDSLETIGSLAFASCSKLTSVELPKCLTKINNEMFRSCGFSELTLPDNIQSFDNQGWSNLQTLIIENRYCEYTGIVSPGFKSDCTIRAYCGSPGHELAVKQLYNFESLGHTYLDWYTYVPATYTSDGIERRDCAYCGGYEERAIPKLQNDIFTATFVADGNVVATVDFPKGTTQIAEPQVPAKDRYMGEWESYTLSDSDITINALYTLIKSADASEIETSSETVNYTDYDDVLFKLKAWAKAKTVKSTVSKAVPLDIVLVLDQSGSMANTLGGTVKKVDALKSTAKEFIGTVYDNAKLTGADHRISVVGFGLSGNYQGYEKNENTELLTSNRGIVKYDNIKKSDYASSLLNVNVNGSVNDKLISAVDSIDARGATAADLGFEMAKGIFANTNSDNRQRVVIFMTDGEPTYSSSFETSVANSAIANASVLKNAYKASIYSVGVFSEHDSRNTYIKTFMNAVSSGYPDAMSMNYLGKGVDGQYYMTVSNTDSLSGVFKSISTESLSHTAPFENVTIIKTLSKYVTLTSQQEKQLRIDLIRVYGITDDDIVITRNDDGTTEIKISSLTPYEVTDDEGNVTYEVAFEFFASLNENAAEKGDYVVDTEDSGVMLGDDALGYEATFNTSTVTLDSKKTRVIFTINGEIYYISEKLSNGYAVAPEMNLADDWQFSGWDTSSKKATNGTVFDAALVKANRTIIWHTAQGDITQSYVEGDYIVLPTIEPYNSSGDLFLSWNKSIPTTMPDENLEFTAVYGGHVHKYSSAVTKEMTCLTDGIRTFTCSCGDTYDETITATGHNYEAITPSLDKADAKCTFCCTYCGDKYDYALDYEVVSASNKKFNVVYEFKLTDEELNTEMQPDGDIKIRIPLSELHGRADRVVVVRTNPDGSKTIVPATIEKGCLVITCDHFTPYEVIFDVPCEQHNQGEWIVTKEATCTEKGFRYANCTECEKKVAEEEIEKIPHDYNSVVTAPTCTAKGYTTYTCSECGHSYTGDEVNALNHDMSKFVTTKAPTCTEGGISTSTCSRCDYCKTKELSPKGHNFEGGVCTACGAAKDESCTCNCHKGGISGFFFKIILFLQRIFGINKICSCGAAHY